MSTEIDEVLSARPDLTIADLYDIIDIMDANDTLLESANKYYPLKQRIADCAA